MARHLTSALAGGAALALAGVGAAQAGGCPSGCPKPPPPPPPVCCNVPNYHQVNVPGVWITPPSVNVQAPSIAIASAQAFASASASASASGQAVSNSAANANANANGIVYAIGGGGSSFFVDQSSTGFIGNVNVEGTAPGRRVCVAYSRVSRVTAVQAVCLDDKAVPHPASQVSPEREIGDAYEGEVFRCIAGARMQYTLADYAGQANFEHGQTMTCQKGEALYHTRLGQLQCRPQTPARDCNERSLLRRFGAGIKIVHASREATCTAYSETQTAAAGGGMALDGGVGGVVH